MNWTQIRPIGPRQKGGSIYAKYYRQPVVAINASGEILVSPEAHDQLGKPDFVQILYDVRNRVFGLRASVQDEFSFKVQHSARTNPNGGRSITNNGMVRISCRSAHEWGMEDSTVFYRAAMDAEGVLVVDTKSRIDIVSTPKRKHNKR